MHITYLGFGSNRPRAVLKLSLGTYQVLDVAQRQSFKPWRMLVCMPVPVSVSVCMCMHVLATGAGINWLASMCRYVGAPFYAGNAALKGGCDLLYLFTAQEAAPAIKGYSPELMVQPIYTCLDPDQTAASLPRLFRCEACHI